MFPNEKNHTKDVELNEMKHFDIPNLIFLPYGFSVHSYKISLFSSERDGANIQNLSSPPLTQAVKLVFLNKSVGLKSLRICFKNIAPNIFLTTVKSFALTG